MDSLFRECERADVYTLTVDLEELVVTTPGGDTYPFEFNPGLRHRLLNGLDDIGITLRSADAIRAYERRRREEAPWFFQD